jgi:hypothetical protein
MAGYWDRAISFRRCETFSWACPSCTVVLKLFNSVLRLDNSVLISAVFVSRLEHLRIKAKFLAFLCKTLGLGPWSSLFGNPIKWNFSVKCFNFPRNNTWSCGSIQHGGVAMARATPCKSARNSYQPSCLKTKIVFVWYCIIGCLWWVTPPL